MPKTPWTERHSAHLEMAWHRNSYEKGQQLWIQEEIRDDVNERRRKRGTEQDTILYKHVSKVPVS